jgi:hypothetical protein
MSTRQIHLIYKTHLDIGFTEHAEKVRRLYHSRFIPQALDTGEHFYAEAPDAPQFIWTTGAWLIWDHLHTQPSQSVARLEAAIEKGIICWHALPFTTHTELMSPALFECGLSFSQELDRRFGKTTIAAKMTDVPGHTLGMVPLLARAGVRFLHLGVNTACPVPDVPPVFRWRAPDGSEVLVMYQNSYGDTYFPEGLETGLSFAHTSDNMGPQAIHQTVELLREYAHRYPGVEIRASALDAFGQLLWDRREGFPVVEHEIGDSWIHGAAADPIKAARFRALQNLFDQFAGDAMTGSRLAFGRHLAMVAEHTCGVDIKTFLRDETAWDRSAFDAARKKDYRFAYSEASWAEQRFYLDQAISALDGDDRAKAHAVLEDLVPPPPAVLSSTRTDITIGGWSVRLDPQSGDIVELRAPGGRIISGNNGSLLGYRHESYDDRDVQSHMDTYLIDRPEWAYLDHAKPGLENAGTAQSAVWTPRFQGIGHAGDDLVVGMTMPDIATATLGGPERLEYRLGLREDALEIAVVLRAKPANRMPESGFLNWRPHAASDWSFLKTGLSLDPANIAAHGGGQMQAVFQACCINDTAQIALTPLDTPLAAPADWPFMAYNPNRPDFAPGIRFCLYNNKWGTNFPMWWEGDFKARFQIRISAR